MKKTLLIALCLLCLFSAVAEGAVFDYRFADADEAAALLLSNRNYYDNLSQNDLNFRMQKLGATLPELEAYAAAQTRDYTDAEKAAIDDAMRLIEETCAELGYSLPPTDGIVFAKTTMDEECGAGAYTHGTQIYLGEAVLSYGTSQDARQRESFQQVVTHELFHCLTRNHPDFRADMYGMLGFTVEAEDYAFPQSIRDVMISNPDVGHHNSHATFIIGGQPVDCTVIFTTARPFEQPGDSFFDDMVTGLVPVDDLSTMYTSDEAENFWDMFGRNTDYVIDPGETLADNFSLTLMARGDSRYFTSPEIVEAIDAYLKSAEWTADAA